MHAHTCDLGMGAPFDIQTSRGSHMLPQRATLDITSMVNGLCRINLYSLKQKTCPSRDRSFAFSFLSYERPGSMARPSLSTRIRNLRRIPQGKRPGVLPWSVYSSVMVAVASASSASSLTSSAAATSAFTLCSSFVFTSVSAFASSGFSSACSAPVV